MHINGMHLICVNIILVWQHHQYAVTISLTLSLSQNLLSSAFSRLALINCINWHAHQTPIDSNVKWSTIKWQLFAYVCLLELTHSYTPTHMHTRAHIATSLIQRQQTIFPPLQTMRQNRHVNFYIHTQALTHTLYKTRPYTPRHTPAHAHTCHTPI